MLVFVSTYLVPMLRPQMPSTPRCCLPDVGSTESRELLLRLKAPRLCAEALRKHPEQLEMQDASARVGRFLQADVCHWILKPQMCRVPTCLEDRAKKREDKKTEGSAWLHKKKKAEGLARCFLLPGVRVRGSAVPGWRDHVWPGQRGGVASGRLRGTASRAGGAAPEPQ